MTESIPYDYNMTYYVDAAYQPPYVSETHLVSIDTLSSDRMSVGVTLAHFNNCAISIQLHPG